MKTAREHGGTKAGRDAPRARAVVLILLLLALAPAGRIDAADVSARVSSREVYSGVPFTLEVSIENAQDFEPPTLPEVPGLRFVGAPSRSSQTSEFIRNGRRTRTTSVTLSYQVIASGPGRITIPALPVVADGQTERTRPIVLNVAQSDAEDLLFVEIVAADDEVYVGEAVALTLRIWIKAFEDPMLTGPLDARSMWSRVLINRSTWGDFVEPLVDLVGPRGERALDGRTIRRAGDDGETSIFHLFEIGVSVWPRKAGPLEVEPVSVVMNYPLRLRRSRSLFSRGDLEVAAARPVVGEASAPAVIVRSPPAAGRPADYAGAVGRFELDVSAAPRDVSVGDPITLTLRVRDRTPGGTRLEQLPPPPLAALPTLDRDFRVPSEPLAGVVDGATKVFTQTVRARRADVESIPAIPFTFFDPKREAYVTVRSTPIPITVEATANLLMTDVVGGAPARETASAGLTEVAGGLLANEVGAARLLSSQRVTLGWGHLLLLGLPPLAFVSIAVGRWRIERTRGDTGYARRRQARRRAEQRIQGTGDLPADERAEAVGRALRDYVADRCNAPDGALTRPEVVERLRAGNVDASLVAEVEAVLVVCEEARFAGGSGAEAEGVSERARQCVRRLERERLR